MKAKLSIISIFVLALALLSVWAVGAQGPQPPQPGPQREPRGLPMRLEPEDKPLSDVPAASARSVRETEEVGNATIPLGQPGLSFRYVQTFGVTEEPYPVDTSHLNGAAGLLMDASNQLYVAEGNGHRVLRFNALGANDLVLGHAGLPWHHDDYLSWPRDVAVDASGNIWVVFSPAVKKFAPSGNPLLTIPGTDPWQSGNDNYHFDDPRGIAFDSLGRLFVSDTGNHRIQVYDVSGSNPVYVLTIGVTGQPRSDNTGFNGPHHIAFDGSGQLYVVDAGNYRVQRCTRNPGPPETWTCTTFFGVTGQEGSDLSHLSRDARGIAIRGNDIFITDSANYRVLKCNLSGGDVVTANWHFGDGSAPLLSNATTVTHTYSTPGVYTVTLTVQDGVDTDVRTRPAHIRIAHFVYLPLVLRNYNPLMMLYDDFNNPTFDGAYDPIKWRFWGDSHYFSARQINGTMVITNTVSTPAEASLGLPLAVPLERTLRQVQRFQAKMMMGNGTSGTGATIQIAREVNGSGWWAQCGLNAYDGNPPYFGCDITNYTSGNYQQEYGVLWPSPLNFNTWYTARIDIDPNTAQVCFYLNGNQLGCRVPNQADTLKMATDLIPRIGSWNGRAGATGVRYFDDVYITPAWP